MPRTGKKTPCIETNRRQPGFSVATSAGRVCGCNEFRKDLGWQDLDSKDSLHAIAAIKDY